MMNRGNLILTTSPLSQAAGKPCGTPSLSRRQRPLYGRKRHSHTGKERDSETGLYYYGARYLDSKTSRWLSGDPAMGEYIPSAPVDDEARKRNGNLPGMGGVFNYVNLHVYHYAGNNPVKYTDPDGRETDKETFKNMSLVGQLRYLKQQVQLGNTLEGKDKGDKAEHLRNLRDSMKLSGLFSLAENFMNGELRDFMNLKEDGTMDYSVKEMTEENGWRKEHNINSAFHQTNTGKYLNTKFVNDDGREVVFNRKGAPINSYPNKGTYNYGSNAVTHGLYDILPYNDLMKEKKIKINLRFL